jgi:hypothetical protein
MNLTNIRLEESRFLSLTPAFNFDIDFSSLARSACMALQFHGFLTGELWPYLRPDLVRQLQSTSLASAPSVAHAAGHGGR